MGEDNRIECPLARDPAASLEWMRPHVEAMAQIEANEIVREIIP